VDREFVNVYRDQAMAEARRLFPAKNRTNGNRAMAP